LPRLCDFETWVETELFFAAIGLWVFEKQHCKSAHDENAEFGQCRFAEPNEPETNQQNDQTQERGF
jgi:hypothetical protein